MGPLSLVELMPATPELAAPVRKQAITSLRQYAEENFGEPLGELAAAGLLDYFLEEIAPVIYNQAITDAQNRMQLRIAELHGEVYAEPFQYWPRLQKRRKARRG